MLKNAIFTSFCYAIGAILILIAQSLIGATQAASTCQDGDPNKLCCEQWVVNIYGQSGTIINNSYAGVIRERDTDQRLSAGWCAHGDQSFCGKSYGKPKCSIPSQASSHEASKDGASKVSVTSRLISRHFTSGNDLIKEVTCP